MTADHQQLKAELRAYREFSEGSTGVDYAEVDVCIRAAAAIEALEAQLAKLEGAK